MIGLGELRGCQGRLLLLLLLYHRDVGRFNKFLRRKTGHVQTFLSRSPVLILASLSTSSA